MKFSPSMDILNDVRNLHQSLSDSQRSFLKDAIIHDVLKFGTANNGIFGTIFGNATNSGAVEQKRKANISLEQDGSNRSLIEAAWKESTAFAFDCALYLSGQTSFSELLDSNPAATFSGSTTPVSAGGPALTATEVIAWAKETGAEELNRLGIVVNGINAFDEDDVQRFEDELESVFDSLTEVFESAVDTFDEMRDNVPEGVIRTEMPYGRRVKAIVEKLTEMDAFRAI